MNDDDDDNNNNDKNNNSLLSQNFVSRYTGIAKPRCSSSAAVTQTGHWSLSSVSAATPG